MNQVKVVVVDYGVGNLYSVQRALECCGVRNVCVSSELDDVWSADKLILPGVGAFEDGMRGLSEKNLIKPIREYAASGKPLLGICLGMQLLATYSEEFGRHDGLGLIPGKAVPIPRETKSGSKLRIPHIGWATLQKPNLDAWFNSPLKDLGEDDAVYLVHSFHVIPDLESNVLATYDYHGEYITAAIRSRNVFGYQFHPEKSGPVGLSLLANFLSL